MTNEHKKALNDLKTKVDERQALAAKADFSAADMQRATTLGDEIKGLKADVERYTAQAALKGASDDDLKFLNEPANALPHVDNGPKSPAQVVGSAPAGETHLDHNLKFLRENGAGIFGQKTYDLINSEEYTKAFNHYIRRGETRSSAWAMKTLSEGLDPQGGAWAPIQVIPSIVQREATPTRIRGRVNRISASSDSAILPTVNYTGNPNDDPNAFIYSTGVRVTNTGELPSSNTAAQVNDSNLFGTKVIQNYTFMLTAVISRNLLEDAAFDVMGWMQGIFGKTVDLLYDNMILNGTGKMQPDGVLNAPTTSYTDLNRVKYLLSGQAFASLPAAPGFIGDDIISLSEDVPEQYDENCAYVFKKTDTGKAIRLLKDNQNRYLFGRGYQDSGIAAGRATELNGYPYIWSQFMPTPSATSYPVLFGDLGGFTLTERIGFSVQVLNELYAAQNLVGLVGRVRFGGRAIEPWRLRLLKSNNA